MMEGWLTILCWISLTLATGTLIAFTCNKARARPVPQKKKPPRKRTEADESLFSKKYDQSKNRKISGNKNSNKDSSKPNNLQPKSKASGQSAGKNSNGELELSVRDLSNPRQPKNEAPEIPQIEVPEIPQMTSSSPHSSDGGDGNQQLVPAAPQKPITREDKEQQSENQITNEKKSHENVTAKEPQPEEIPKMVAEAETGKEFNKKGASSKSRKKKKKHKKRKRESDGDEDSSKKKKKKHKKKKVKDKDDDESDGSSGKRKSSKRHKKKKKHHKNPKEDEENDLNPQEVLPVMSPAKTKFENEPPPKSRDEFRNHDPGMMTQLNNVLFDGAEDGDVAIPSQLKKAVAKQEEKEANFTHLPLADANDKPQISPAQSNADFVSMPPFLPAKEPAPSSSELKKAITKQDEKEAELTPSPVAAADDKHQQLKPPISPAQSKTNVVNMPPPPLPAKEQAPSPSELKKSAVKQVEVVPSPLPEKKQNDEIPVAVKKQEDETPLAEKKQEDEKDDRRQSSHANTNEVIARKMEEANKNTSHPSVTNFEPIVRHSPLITPPSKQQQPAETKPSPRVLLSPIKPKFIPREAKAEKIAKLGLKRKKEDYPTMNDVVSDWDSKEEVFENNNGAKKNKNEMEAAAKKNEEDELKLRKQEETALEKSQKKNEAEDEGKKKQPSMKPEDLLEKLRKDEEERVKKLRANKPMPKKIKRNTYEEKIAKGEVVRKKNEYPTFGDVLSDWESVDEKTAPSSKEKKSKGKK